MKKESSFFENLWTPQAFVLSIIAAIGILFITVGVSYGSNSILYAILLPIGGSLLSTSALTYIFNLVFTKEIMRKAKDELKPTISKLMKVVRTIDAFEAYGLESCHSKRTDALAAFYEHAARITKMRNPRPENSYVDIVSNSAKNLLRQFNQSNLRASLRATRDRDQPIPKMLELPATTRDVQRAWRNMIVKHPDKFRILLTHPAYAHARQFVQGEHLAIGIVESEIIKAALFLTCVAKMSDENLRFYRGAPTVFSVKAGDRILMNPYPYGETAMHTISFEFNTKVAWDKGSKDSPISEFHDAHFSNTWNNEGIVPINFHSPGTNLPIVTYFNKNYCILHAFAECQTPGKDNSLRFTQTQVDRLDEFTRWLDMYSSRPAGPVHPAKEGCWTNYFKEHIAPLELDRNSPRKIDIQNPFSSYAAIKGLTCRQ